MGRGSVGLSMMCWVVAIMGGRVRAKVSVESKGKERPKGLMVKGQRQEDGTT